MDFLQKDSFSGEILPILLGAGRTTRSVSRQFFRSYGAISHLFCPRIPPLFHLSLFMKFHRVSGTRNNALLLQALLDFSGQFEGRDLLLCLVPCTAEMESFVRDHRRELEPSYVLLNQTEILRYFEKEGVTA